MIKNKFYKNVFQSVSWGLSFAIPVLALLVGFFESLTFEQPNYGWLLLVISGGVVVLFFGIGFYWIFQTIEIDGQGIQVKILGKTIRRIHWTEITDIQSKSVMKNPAYVLSVCNQKDLNLDERNKIKTAIEHYSDDNVRTMLMAIRSK